MRHHNHGLRKRCRCKWKDWPKCRHEWYFDFKPRGGSRYRFSLDAELGRHVTSKTEAQQEAAAIRTAILAGTFVRAADRRKLAAAVPARADAITLKKFAQVYLERHAKTCGKKTWKNDEGMLNRLGAFVQPLPDEAEPFGDKQLAAITEDDIELFLAHLRHQNRAASTRNKYVQLCKAMFRWGVRKGYLTRNPIVDSETIRREKMAQRKRRLQADVFDNKGQLVRPGEERRLLKHAPGHLQRLIIAAIETGCRRGELLNLTWADVNLNAHELRIRAEHAKDGEQRILPISSRLAAVLEMVRTNPAGCEYPASAFVFGELGCRLKTIKKAWETRRTQSTRARARVGEERFAVADLAGAAPGDRSAFPRPAARSRFAVDRGGLAHPPRPGNVGSCEPGADQHVSQRDAGGPPRKHATVRAGWNPWHNRVTSSRDRAPASEPRCSRERGRTFDKLTSCLDHVRP